MYSWAQRHSALRRWLPAGAGLPHLRFLPLLRHAPQPPDAVAVDAVMLGPPTPTQNSGGAASARISKDAPERQARMEEDDGLVVRQRPKARADNNARRKQRAGRESNPNDWFDPEDDGLRCMADPVPPGCERSRPARWFNPDAPYLQTVPATKSMTSDDTLVTMADGGVAVGAMGIAGTERTYRLEVHVGRLEFSCHPHMGKEDHLAAKLEESFRAFKRREASGLVALYTAKSAAASARANALKQEMAAGAALWLEGVAPRERLAALEEEAEEARRLAMDETERSTGAVRQRHIVWARMGGGRGWAERGKRGHIII